MRLIDADALKEALEEMEIIIDKDVLECNSIHEELLYLLKKVDAVLAEKIDEQPTIEAPNVVHGEWTKIYGSCMYVFSFRCSECNKLVEFDTNFCPNCGADMRKKV